MPLFEGGIIGELKKRKAQRQMDTFRDSFVAKLADAGANDDALELVSKIKAESPEKLVSAFNSIQEAISKGTEKGIEKTIQDKVRETSLTTEAKNRVELSPQNIQREANKSFETSKASELAKLTPEVTRAKVDQELEVGSAKFGSIGEVYKRTSEIRKEFQALPTIKDYQIIRNQVESMDALLENIKTGDGNSALALDQGLITLFNKITDPTSVVRESEYERTPKNLSLANRFKGAFAKLEKGGAGLTKEDREALVFGAKIIADSRAKIYNQNLDNYKKISAEFGANPDLVTGGYDKATLYLDKEKTTSGKTKSGVSWKVV